MNDKIIRKRNFKTAISIWQNTPAPNFSQFGELQLLRPNLPKNTFGWSFNTNAT